MTNPSDQQQSNPNVAEQHGQQQPESAEANQQQQPDNGVQSAMGQQPGQDDGNQPQPVASNADSQVADTVDAVKSKVTAPVPTPSGISSSQAAPQELLQRLNWGEPALTIIDVRSRSAFNDERIQGAIPIPMGQLPKAAEASLEYSRDIYIYGDSDDEAAEAVERLRQVGYRHVASIQGGLSAWKSINGSTEGISAFASPVTA
ncbi:rhodanese-like domain-containing protein [Nodosilinea sp. P-1105]|uniref:rhodanese-like domain-containing protein n=1 Tax=Nodosilinea sp. P-1105 TaxID=2546229 RepID=UPI00146A7403|nr:rhodanese-like domain-containing protein [Nodosilinea sp. P-1105]NMF82670.1 rhodanese-like domain-containing protein [Nodosilinea sp. P-1105]